MSKGKNTKKKKRKKPHPKKKYEMDKVKFAFRNISSEGDETTLDYAVIKKIVDNAPGDSMLHSPEEYVLVYYIASSMFYYERLSKALPTFEMELILDVLYDGSIIDSALCYTKRDKLCVDIKSMHDICDYEVLERIIAISRSVRLNHH